MADNEQNKKIIPLLTREIPFGQHVFELVFGVNLTDLDFWVQIDSVKQLIQSRATLWVRESCLIVGLLPLIIILITASLSSKTYNMALAPECIVLDGMCSMLVGMTLVCLNWMGLCMFGLTTAEGFPRSSLLGPSVLFGMW